MVFKFPLVSNVSYRKLLPLCYTSTGAFPFVKSSPEYLHYFFLLLEQQSEAEPGTSAQLLSAHSPGPVPQVSRHLLQMLLALSRSGAAEGLGVPAARPAWAPVGGLERVLCWDCSPASTSGQAAGLSLGMPLAFSYWKNGVPLAFSYWKNEKCFPRVAKPAKGWVHRSHLPCQHPRSCHKQARICNLWKLICRRAGVWSHTALQII